MSIKLITDSACDLPESVIKEYNIDVIPILVNIDDKEYLDGITLKAVDLYKDMRDGKVYKTAQVPFISYRQIFEKYAKEKVNCIYLCFSSGLSGMYQTSILAKNELLEKYPDFDIDIVDTKCASVGFGLVVYKAAQMIAEGKSKSDILKAINFNSSHMEHIFTVDDLEYVCRGGRVSRTAAFVGGLLNIKPILDVEDGNLIPIEKVRGRKKLLKRMIEIAQERGVDLSKQTIGINHGDDIEGAETLKKMLEDEFGCKDFLINIIGCAIGTHSGPGTLSIFFLNKKYSD